ncbi:MMPL family transporter [Streptacidiphilus rugosus]|uniref:MMPL family transporter n=1 Tax=Streptacidiphilus rugosus TaxID=405783 RepID=UPI0005699F6A|nr:MMPL family transporter [Streptacidiphilus rugosus]
MSVLLSQVARWMFRRRRMVLCVWLLVAVGAVVLAVASGGKTNDTFTIPGTDSQKAANLLMAKVPELGGGQSQVVFATHGSAKVTDAPYRTGIESAVAGLRKAPQVAVVFDPFQTGGVSRDGHTALGTVQYTAQPGGVREATLTAVQEAVVPARDAGVQVDYSGSVYPGWRLKVSEGPELVGLVVAFVILLVTFGAFVAAGLPIITAVVGVVTTLMGVTAVAAVTDIASASTTVALMLGLSCGIDYGLFIFSRHRNNLIAGMEPEDAVALALGTAGSSVVFAALTVIIALCGLAVVGIPFLTVMGVAAAAGVFVALLVALTLLPAGLGFAGDRVARFISTPLRPGHHERVARIAAVEPGRTCGSAWGRFVVRRRIPVVVAGIAILGALALPAARMDLGLPSGATKPVSDTQRRAYDLTTAGFGAGYNGPLLVVADPAGGTAVRGITSWLAGIPGTASVTPVAQANGVSVIRVIPKTGPEDPATSDVVHRIRAGSAVTARFYGSRILVGGTTASDIDVSAKLSAALPVFLVTVIGLALLALTFAFRTVLVPLKSVVGFLLSVGSAFGLSVAVFQWGWGAKLLGITPGQTVSFLPILVLAVVFGLSSDYEVFVVSRIKEEFGRTGDARLAAANGTGHAARVVTAAALIMFSIFVAFMVTDDPIIKAIAFTFAAGVLLDAFVVRLTLVPAVMALVNSKIWYHPQWFARYVPDPDIEGERLQARFDGADQDHDPAG